MFSYLLRRYSFLFYRGKLRKMIARTKWSDENMCLSKILYKPTISSLPTAAATSQSRRDIGLLE